MPKFAGVEFTPEQIRGTVNRLRYYRRFLKSDYDECRDPESCFSWRLTKDQARNRLTLLVNVAINRKAGIPDAVGRKQDPDYQASQWRDCRAVRNKLNRRVIVRQFETPEIRKRYGHLLTTWGDE